MRAIAAVALLTLVACDSGGATWSLYHGTVTSDASPPATATARLTVAADGDTAFAGYFEIDKPLAHRAGSVWGWYLPDSVAFLTVSASEDTVLWVAARPADTTERLDGRFEVIGGRSSGQRGSWTATLSRGISITSLTTISHGTSGRVSWLVFVLGFLGLSIATGWALRPDSPLRAEPPILSATDAEVNGVGGWMVWFLFGQGVTIIWTLVQLRTVYAPFHDGTWEMGQIFAGFHQLLTLELLMASLQIAAPLLGLILTVRHDARAPRVWFVYLAVLVVYSIVEVVAWPQLRSNLASAFGEAAAEEASREIATDMGRTARTIAVAPIWMAYWSVSRRVRITFGRGALGRPPDYMRASLVPRRAAPANDLSTAADAPVVEEPRS